MGRSFLRQRQSHGRSRSAFPRFDALEDRCTPAAVDLLAVGAAAGGAAHVKVLDGDGGIVLSFMAYDPAFTGGVRVASGDVNGDSVNDIITGAGAGGGPNLKIFDGRDGALLRDFLAFDDAFVGGIHVASGDVNNDGYADVVASAGSFSPHIKVFSGKDNALLHSFLAFDPAFGVGVQVSSGDVNADGRADIIAAVSGSGAPHVKVFSGADLTLLQSYFAYDPEFLGGVSVAAGDVNADGYSDVLTGAGSGGGPHVKVFSGADGSLYRSFFALDGSFTGGVQVGVCFLPGSTAADVVAAAGPGGEAKVGIFSGASLESLRTFSAFSDGFAGGVFAGGACLRAADNVIAWNRAALEAIRTQKTNPPVATRALAMMHAAVYDAVNAIEQSYPVYHVNVTPPAGANADAAAAAAAHRVLSNLFPTLNARFDVILSGTLAFIPEGPGKQDGIILGQQVADAILAWRASDGWNVSVPYTPGTNPGDWQPTPPANASALLPNWPTVTPWTMTSGDQFRPSGPPALSSSEWAADYNEVKDLGAVNSSTRTAEQSQIALFWADGVGSVTPPGHWNQIAQDRSLAAGLSLLDNARLFAMLTVGQADAAISCWDAKYAYNFWRPVTAIRAGDTDGNPDTAADPTWSSFITTPPFPDYTSGHSTFSGVSATILASVFGAETSFVTSSDALPNVARTFSTFAQAADEAALSRLYGGIHYRTANEDGLAAGHALADYLLENYF